MERIIGETLEAHDGSVLIGTGFLLLSVLKIILKDEDRKYFGPDVGSNNPISIKVKRVLGQKL